MLMLDMARALSMGGYLFLNEDFKCVEPCKVLILEQELGEYVLSDRCQKVWRDEKDLDRVNENLWYVSRSSHINFSTRVGLDLVRKWLDLVQPNVLILDPIGKMHHYMENDAQHVNSLMENLDALRDDYVHNSMSIVFSHHFGKANPDPDRSRDVLDPYNFRGSTKWIDDVDTIITGVRPKKWTFIENPGTPQKYKWWKLRLGFTLRAGQEPENIVVSINEFNDLRVRFQGYEDGENQEKWFSQKSSKSLTIGKGKTNV